MAMIDGALPSLEGSIKALERWARALILQRRHLLSQREVFQNEVASAPTNRHDGTCAE